MKINYCIIQTQKVACSIKYIASLYNKSGDLMELKRQSRATIVSRPLFLSKSSEERHHSRIRLR